MKKLTQKSSIISMILLSCLLFVLTHGVQMFFSWREWAVYGMYGEYMDQGMYEVADVLMMSQDTDEARYNQGHAWFWSGVDAIGSSLPSPQPSPKHSSYLVTRRGSADGVDQVYDIQFLEDESYSQEVIQSRERAVDYFSGSTYSGASHNAEVIRTLLGVADESDEESEESEELEESDEKSDKSEESGDQSKDDESSDAESQESEKQGEWDEDTPGERSADDQPPNKKESQLPESVKEQLQDYAQQLQEQQAQNQQFFNKQPQDTQPSQDLFEALFGQPQFRQQIGGGGEKDW